MSKVIELSDMETERRPSLMSPIQSIIDQAIDAQKEIARIRNGSVRKRSNVVSLLSDLHSAITYATKLVKKNEFRAYEDVLAFRDSVKTSATACMSLSKLVKAKEIRPVELGKRLKAVEAQLQADVKLGLSITAYMSEAQTDDDTEQDSRAASRDRRESAAASRANRVLKQLRAKHAHKVPKQFKDAVRFITLPIMANFGNLAMSARTLSVMGFPTIDAGLHSTSSSDLGTIFEDQLVMMFRQSDARQTASLVVEADKDGSQIVQERKALQKERAALGRTVRKLEKAFDEAASKADRKDINDQLDEVEEKIDELTKQLDALDPDMRIEKSRQRVKSQMVNSDEHYILAYVTPILDAINKQKGTDYALFTGVPLRGIMRDSDVICVWLMEKNAVKLIQNHTNFDPKLKDWYLPWKNK